MTVAACAALVQRGDPDRFLAVMAAPPAARPPLFVLYAFNLEVARAPWVTAESMIAEMRLQWWRDTVAGPRRAHEVAGPLHDLIHLAGLPIDVLDRLIAARRWDCWHEPFEGAGALEAYLDETGGGLMWLAARALGAPAGAEGAARDLGFAIGMANYLRAVTDLAARGRAPLPEGVAVERLAKQGLDRLARGRAGMAALGPARAAALAGWQAGPLLRQAKREPARVTDGTLGLSEFARRARLLWAAARGGV